MNNYINYYLEILHNESAYETFKQAGKYYVRRKVKRAIRKATGRGASKIGSSVREKKEKKKK